MKKFIGISGGLTAVALAVGVVFAATTVVHPGDTDGWTFLQETPTGSGQFVDGPATPPAGEGSAEFTVDSTGGVVLAKEGYQGVRFDDITTLEYSTYRQSGGDALAVALQLNIDNDVTDADNAWKGRLVYEPYHTETVLSNTWQTWNALEGEWWGTGALIAAACPQSNPCTTSELLTHFPNLGVHNTLGAVVLKAGGSWAGGFVGNADALTIGVNGEDTTYDFELQEPEVSPTPTPVPQGPMTKDDCKDGGWKNYPTFGFKNQGQCIKYVNHLTPVIPS